VSKSCVSWQAVFPTTKSIGVFCDDIGQAADAGAGSFPLRRARLDIAVIAGHTGFGMSQRARFYHRCSRRAFVYEPSGRPRVTHADAYPRRETYLCFSVRAATSQDRICCSFSLIGRVRITSSDRGSNINSFQMRSSFGEHEIGPGRMPADSTPQPSHEKKMGTRSRSTQADQRHFSTANTAQSWAAPGNLKARFRMAWCLILF
jgi:hypothetical protein